MRRREVLGGLGLAAFEVGAAPPAIADPEERRYLLITEIELLQPAGEAVLYLPVLERRWAGQTAGPPKITSSGEARLIRDARYGAGLVRAQFPKGVARRTLRVAQTVRTLERGLAPARLSRAEQAFWTAPAPSLPTGGVVRETAMKIVAGASAPRARARAIYDWVVDNTFRDAAVRGCGIGGVEAMLRSGYLGGKCADINSLLVALCRAAGLPARDVYGVRLGPSREVACLGASGPDVTRAQHCRSEVFLEGEGWLPVDPADVRKVVLEAKAAPSSELVRGVRERLFGRWEMNWAAYNSATDLSPPGAPRAPVEHFLMYPMALSSTDEADQLDPDAFRYRLRSVSV